MRRARVLGPSQNCVRSRVKVRGKRHTANLRRGRLKRFITLINYRPRFSAFYKNAQCENRRKLYFLSVEIIKPAPPQVSSSGFIEKVFSLVVARDIKVLYALIILNNK